MSHRPPMALYCICIGVGLLGIIASVIPVLSGAEENVGLHLLYVWRGPAEVKADVVVVAIDNESAQALNLPLAANKWPRSIHARLLERLAARQASVIAFDLLFHEPQDAINDQRFAAAMKNAGNVLLTQTIDRQTMPISDSGGTRATYANIERMVSAMPLLANAAAGQAPFPLPKVPVKLNQFWCFRAGSGDMPTLPVVALHVHAKDAVVGLIHLLREVDADSAGTLPIPQDDAIDARTVAQRIRPLHALFEKDPTLASRALERLDSYPADKIPATTVRMIRTLIQLHGQEKSRYLNLYGPHETIRTLSYYRVVSDSETSLTDDERAFLRHAAVFVGQTESNWIKTHDGFYTDFTGKSGQDISGVEIAATAFANLLENKSVHPLSPQTGAMLLMAWGILAGMIGFHFSSALSATGLLLLNGIYCWVAFFQFKSNGAWYPLIVPMVVQTPAAFIAGLVWKYRKATVDRKNIREAFGYYLPDEVVDRLSANTKEVSLGGQVFYGICLFTDAQNYTPLSESMDPDSLTRLMNAYYEAIFKPIKVNGGLVLQVVGDSVLAIWTAPEPRRELKRAACRAAIEITTSVNQFNRRAGPHALPTRIGIHAGEILLGSIGAMDHFEYRPVGDIVNTASRLEGLNKFLGTWMLASNEVIDPDGGCPSRPVGGFVFKGKSQPVLVYELLPQDKRSSEPQTEVYRMFSSGLDAFRNRRWDEADQFFNHALQIDATDGPSLFYRQRCREFQELPPDGDWDGAVRLKQK
jgi:adenylate cyclase